MLLLLDDLSDAEEVVFKNIVAPIFNPIGQVLLALSITGPGESVRVDHIRKLGRRLVQSAAIATRQSRGRIPSS